MDKDWPKFEWNKEASNHTLDAMKYMIAVDWARNSGYSRGDIIKREDNVVFVRFKTVDFRGGMA